MLPGFSGRVAHPFALFAKKGWAGGPLKPAFGLSGALSMCSSVTDERARSKERELEEDNEMTMPGFTRRDYS